MFVVILILWFCVRVHSRDPCGCALLELFQNGRIVLLSEATQELEADDKEDDPNAGDSEDTFAAYMPLA